MENLFQTKYRAAAVYSLAALHVGGRIFHQCKASLRAAAQPHYAFPKKRLGTYVEEGKSGKSIEGRTEFQRMLDDIQSGKVHTDYVLVFKLS